MNFSQLTMAKFSAQFEGQDLVSMHNTNPEAFTQIELENTIGASFSELLKDTNLGFCPDEGTFALRKVLARNLYSQITPDQVITHPGAQEALYCAYHALLSSHDRVLVVTPIFEPLAAIPQSIGCDVNYTCLLADEGWKLDLDDIEKHFKQGCKLFVINFPHNPTGAHLSKCELTKVIDLCKKYDVWLLSDEVFRGLEHSRTDRLPAVADLYDKGISVGVISKAYAVPGIRVGWLVCKNKVLRKLVIKIKGYLSVCNSQIDEKLMEFIIPQHEKLLDRNLKIVLNNKVLIKNNNVFFKHKAHFIIPKAGCCFFVRMLDSDVKSEIVAKNLATKKGYLLFPSSVFLSNDNALRVGFGSRIFKEFIKEVL